MIKFFKYNSCGNDFIIIDNRDKSFLINSTNIKKLCDRKFGVGADGLILLEKSSDANYFMNYFNSDGFMSSFCGNGNLCCAHFAHHLGVFELKNKAIEGTFSTREGVFNLRIIDDKVIISMPDIKNYNIQKKQICQDIVINTGSPHYVIFRDNLNALDINPEACLIRNSKLYKDEGINVNFVDSQMLRADSKFRNSTIIDVRTYERGVESETLSCGTGVVASAISEVIYYILNLNSRTLPLNFFHSTKVNTLGGVLDVEFQCSYQKKNNNFNFNFSNILLSNNVDMVFQGKIPF